jgi:RNA polymerase sigma factor (sigma-70 family)
MNDVDAADDQQLREAYVRDRDEAAFGQIVERHARWIFAAALRQLGDRHLAEDAVQIVFTILAQKAPNMNARQKLSGWLFNTLQFTVKNVHRAERSRRKHESSAARSIVEEAAPDSAMVRECAARLDAAVARLPAIYREAILLRFHQDLPIGLVARALGTNEPTARKRVGRAVAALRKQLGGAASPPVVSAAAVQGLNQMPATLVPAATKAALTGGASATAISAGVRQVVSLMTMAKAQIAALISLVCLVIAVPAMVVTWRAVSQSIGSVQTNPRSNAAIPTTTAASTTVGGIVRNEGGRPLEGVRVHLEWETSTPGKNGGPPQLPFGHGDVRTGADGRWKYSSASLSDSSNPTIRLERAGYGSDEDAAPVKGNLNDQTAEFVMTRGVAVIGMVVDQKGNPIAGAEVSTIEVRYVVNATGNTVTSRTDGRFAFPPQTTGPIALTTTARGYAPDLQRLTVADGMAPVRIVLSPGNTIRGRVMDQNGNPVQGAYVRASSWREMNSLQWTGVTGPDGRFIMHNAPADAVEFMVESDEYHDLVIKSLTAGDGETTILMSSEPAIRGTVTDADTGQPISRFEIIRGMTYRAGSLPFFDFAQPVHCSDGTFDLPLRGNNEIASYCLRVEADGYVPLVTPYFQNSARFNLALHRGADLRGSVVDPDGNPVAAAQIVLALPWIRVQLSENRVRPPYNTEFVEADSTGQFRFRPQIGNFQLLALCESGYSIQAFDQEPQKPVQLKISPWSKLDAAISLPKLGKQSSRIQVMVEPVEPYSDNCVAYEFDYSTSVTGGRIALDKIPGFGGKIVQIGVFPYFRGGTYERRWIPLRLIPGQTVQADLSGATIIGNLAYGDATEVRTGGIRLTPLIETPARDWPVDASSENTLPLPNYDFQGGAHFQITGVVPGKYLYEAVVGTNVSFQRFTGELEVHTEDIGKTIDLGTLVCRSVAATQIGQRAPDVLGRTLDETPIALADFAGKFVVGVMWDSDPRASAEPAQLLESLSNQFVDNPKVALLGINLDAIDAVSGLVTRPAVLSYRGWTNGYLCRRDMDLVLQVLRHRPAIFIIGPDGKLLARDLSAAQTIATLQRIMAKPN